ncbi:MULTISPECIES: hypothetical protein [Paenibacillus]|uniref:hypothetical protein n=1 Tax=Paenibacillus TaxID=44249 RepID=UPI002DC01F7D|nr:hypothetical protein [Paenibacillus odorifer]MEC0131535.1 hypothetical protein [Paenibacillus odorifer]MEC0220312.1 hypothetical protein [Paenibacillus odorifer]
MSSNKRLQRLLPSGSPAVPDDVNKRSKQEWIESAVVLKRERFEIAGALFDCPDDALLSQQEVIQKVEAYLGLTTKEETVNVDTTE